MVVSFLWAGCGLFSEAYGVLSLCLIFLTGRNKFISNYYKGAIAFVDEYWKIIHRAAGWDALRYWLFVRPTFFFLT